MKYLFSYAWLLIFAMFQNSKTAVGPFPDQIKGVVIDTVTGQPIEKAYIYIVAGEEEALTKKDGAFEITTWQKFPLTIQIQHDQYLSYRIVYKTASDIPTIKLRSKN